MAYPIGQRAAPLGWQGTWGLAGAFTRMPSRLLPPGPNCWQLASAGKEANFAAYLPHSLQHIFFEFCTQDSKYLKLVKESIVVV